MATARADDGVELAYRVRGEGPRDLLFMHGWAGSGAYWDELLEHLDLTALRAITFDFRGHGDSQDADGFGDERLARDALAVADAVSANEFVVVGFSMSGRFAQYVSVLEPDRVQGQILLAGCPASTIPLPDEVIEGWTVTTRDRSGLQELFLSAWATQPVSPDSLERFLDDAAKVSFAALRGTLRTCADASFADRLGDIQTPTLVVGGRDDTIFTPDALRHGVVAPLPRARLVLLDCCHEIPLERPRELAALIEAFLAGLP